MERWVIRPFISEEHIRLLDKEKLLYGFAMCSKPIILKYVVDYLNGEGDDEIKNMLRSAYSEKLNFMDVTADVHINESVAKVATYNYSSVRAGCSVQELEEIRDTIKSVYNENCNVPYINVIRGDIIDGVINNLSALYRVNKNKKYKELAYILSKNKELFKDKPNARATGTIFKSIARRSSEFDIILRGIDFLIPKIQEGKQPESWRVF